MAFLSCLENFGPSRKVQWSSRSRIRAGLSRSAAAWRALGVGGSHKGVVIFAKRGSLAFQFYLDEVMAVEPIGGVKGQEGSHSEHQGSQDWIADIKVVVGKAAAAFAQDLVIRISRGELGLSRAQRRPLLHALEDEVDPIALGSCHAAQPRLDKL